MYGVNLRTALWYYFVSRGGHTVDKRTSYLLLGETGGVRLTGVNNLQRRNAYHPYRDSFATSKYVCSRGQLSSR